MQHYRSSLSYKQYPHKPEAEWGIRDTTEGLIHAGVLEPSVSEWNTPILPVEKKGTGKYHMAHDLRAVNEVLLTPTIPVPNPVTILHHPKPEKVKDMLSFLGLTGYSRHYIPDYVGHTQALRDMVKVQGMRNLNATLEWTEEGETAFIRLKQLLAQAVDLASPDSTRPFFLDVSETAGTVNGVLFRKKGGERQVLMHVSTQLDNMEKRHPTCTQHAAGVAKAIQKTAHLVMGHPITVLTTHSVIAYVNSQAFTLTALRQQRISKILEAPHITYTHEGINMADMMGGEPHQCEQEVKKQEKVRPDLEGEPIPGAWNMFTDGCGFRGPDGDIKAGYAVVAETQGQVDEFWTMKAERLKGWQSAQRAEVIAVVEALKLAKGKEVNIYTDSAYTSLDNKLDDLRARIKFQRDIRDCNLLCFTKSWLNPAVPNHASQPAEFFSVHHMDRMADLGKSRGGEVCVMVNNSWCNNANVVTLARSCSPNLELLNLKLPPFYLPREFTSVINNTVYIPPQANMDTALCELHEALTQFQAQHRDTALIVVGDFNSANLKSAVPNLYQHVTFPTTATPHTRTVTRH
ncbi:hypothetical protein P4O66_001870 [Electrophorus voltai]|uniref:RNase H type-1 domain-containing protein n=1 Tax=Electrophorus voltai TaxID=2609070 RepID=A0AAD9DUF4_9TELE|nr:hypothetical protein P4O66_001870 [Electrophorus voltai]